MGKIKVRNIGQDIQLDDILLKTGEVKEVEWSQYVQMHMDSLRLVSEERFQEFMKGEKHGN